MNKKACRIVAGGTLNAIFFEMPINTDFGKNAHHYRFMIGCKVNTTRRPPANFHLLQATGVGVSYNQSNGQG